MYGGGGGGQLGADESEEVMLLMLGQLPQVQILKSILYIDCIEQNGTRSEKFFIYWKKCY
jgi:hypothetical protein